MDRQRGSSRAHRPFRGSRGNTRGRGSRGLHQQLDLDHQHTPTSTAVSTTANTPINSSGRNTPVPHSLINDDPASHLSNSRFSDLKGQVDQRLLDAIPFERMSEVQVSWFAPSHLCRRDSHACRIEQAILHIFLSWFNYFDSGRSTRWTFSDSGKRTLTESIMLTCSQYRQLLSPQLSLVKMFSLRRKLVQAKHWPSLYPRSKDYVLLLNHCLLLRYQCLCSLQHEN
jgi:hypothetical protein